MFGLYRRFLSVTKIFKSTIIMAKFLEVDHSNQMEKCYLNLDRKIFINKIHILHCIYGLGLSGYDKRKHTHFCAIWVRVQATIL